MIWKSWWKVPSIRERKRKEFSHFDWIYSIGASLESGNYVIIPKLEAAINQRFQFHFVLRGEKKSWEFSVRIFEGKCHLFCTLLHASPHFRLKLSLLLRLFGWCCSSAISIISSKGPSSKMAYLLWLLFSVIYNFLTWFRRLTSKEIRTGRRRNATEKCFQSPVGRGY